MKNSNIHSEEELEFMANRKKEIQSMGKDKNLSLKSLDWRIASAKYNYTYHFDWLARPIIQQPADILQVQEIIWSVKPDLIIETGIARGGSLILNASMLAMLDISEAIESDLSINPKESKRKVLGIDIDIRSHNREAIELHPMSSRIQMIEGSSISNDVIKQVHEIVSDYETILVFLDSNHTHDHVLGELNAYANLTSVGSYCVVFDTIVEDLPAEMFPDRPWGPGNNPKTAVWEFLKDHPEFQIDEDIPNKLLVSVAPDGFLKRVL